MYLGMSLCGNVVGAIARLFAAQNDTKRSSLLLRCLSRDIFLWRQLAVGLVLLSYPRDEFSSSRCCLRVVSTSVVERQRG